MKGSRRRLVLRLLFGVGYVLLGLLGAFLFGSASTEPEPDRHILAFSGALIGLVGLVGVGGLVMILFIPLFDRFRPGPVVGTAPSGAPATCFGRSLFMVTVGVLMRLGLVCWLAALALVLYGAGHDIWGSLVALCAAGLLWPLVPVATGKVKPGGLWLTRSGLEYRREAVSWNLSWSELDGLEYLQGKWTVIGVLPSTGGRSVPVDPVVLRLEPGARLDVQSRVGRMWNRECRMPDGLVCVDCFDLAGGPVLIAETIERYLAYPGQREQLGTEWSLPRRAT
jgi:hypothetical protein